MDKEEFRIKLEEINRLVGNKDYKGAMDIVETIDWRRVKNIRTLCTVGEIYAANKKFKESREIFLLAYHKSSVGKSILYRLIEVSIKIGDLDEALDYYNEYIEVAPNDNTRYILKYKIYAAKKADIQEQIKILEEYKEKEFTERWAYELTKLYYKAGEKVKCIELCNDMFLWFGDGKYVTKSLELKRRLTNLTPSQEKVYNKQFSDKKIKAGLEKSEESVKAADSLSKALEEAEKNSLQKESFENIEKQDSVIEEEEEYTPVIETIKVDKPKQEEKAGSAFAPIIDSTESLHEKITKGIKDIFSSIGKEKEEFDISEEELVDNHDNVEENQEEGPSKEYEDVRPAKIKDIEVPDLEPENIRLFDEEKKSETKESPQLGEIPKLDLSGFNLNKIEAPVVNKEIDESFILPKEINSEKVLEEADKNEINTEEVVENTIETADEIAEAVEDTIDHKEEIEAEDFEETVDDTVETSDEIEEVVEDTAETSDEIEEIAENTAELSDEIEEVVENTAEASDEIEEVAEDTIETSDEIKEIAENTAELSDEIEEVEENISETSDEIQEIEKYTVGDEEKVAEEDDILNIVIKDPEEFLEDEFKESIINKDNSEEVKEETTEETETEEISEENEKLEEETVTEEIVVNKPDPVEEEPEEEELSEEDKLMRFIDSRNPNLQYEANDIVPREKKLDDDELAMFTYFSGIPGMKEQLAEALYDVQLAAADKTSSFGNVIIMGREGAGKTRLAQAFIQASCRELNLEASKVALVTGSQINGKDILKIVDMLSGGFLIIEKANQMNAESVDQLNQAMQFRTDGLTVVIEDERIGMRKLMAKYPKFAEKFTSTISIPVFTNDELVAFAKTYAVESGYKMDEMGVLALYNLIGDNQKADEPMTIDKVRAMVDSAISKAESGTRKLQRNLSKKRTNEDGLVILYEKDFK